MGHPTQITLDLDNWVNEMVDQVMSSRPKKGEFRVVTLLEDPPVLIEITQVINNDLCRVVKGNCVLTGKEIGHGMYTDNQIKRLGPALNAMEVLAWTAK